MSIFSKLITLLRGTAHETGQKAVDANALRILDQKCAMPAPSLRARAKS